MASRQTDDSDLHEPIRADTFGNEAILAESCGRKAAAAAAAAGSYYGVVDTIGDAVQQAGRWAYAHFGICMVESEEVRDTEIQVMQKLVIPALARKCMQENVSLHVACEVIGDLSAWDAGTYAESAMRCRMGHHAEFYNVVAGDLGTSQNANDVGTSQIADVVGGDLSASQNTAHGAHSGSMLVAPEQVPNMDVPPEQVRNMDVATFSSSASRDGTERCLSDHDSLRALHSPYGVRRGTLCWILLCGNNPRPLPVFQVCVSLCLCLWVWGMRCEYIYIYARIYLFACAYTCGECVYEKHTVRM